MDKVVIDNANVNWDVDAEGKQTGPFSMTMWLRAETPFVGGNVTIKTDCWLCNSSILKVGDKVTCTRCQAINYSEHSNGKWHHVTVRFGGSGS